MQHSNLKNNRQAPAMEGKQAQDGEGLYPEQEEDGSDLPDYFRHFSLQGSHIKDSHGQQSYWSLDFGNDNEENFEIVNDVVNSLGIHSDEEDYDRKPSPLVSKAEVIGTNSHVIDVETAKIKSLKPKNKIIRKNLEQHLTAANLKAVKEVVSKQKAKKNKDACDKKKQKEVSGIIKTESKDTFPNSSDGTYETKNIDTQEFNKSGPFEARHKNVSGTITSANTEEFEKPKTKSQLSLKSKAYTRTNITKNVHNNSHNSLDEMQKFNVGYHRHSLPQRAEGFSSGAFQFTPSTNYDIPSSDEKRSEQMRGLPSHLYSPVPFGKNMQSNSHDTFPSLDKVDYSGYSNDNLIPSGNYFNNTMPLPNMGSFTARQVCSPDLCVPQYPFYPAPGSSGRVSTTSDAFQHPQFGYYEQVGKSWPKIPQNMSPTNERFATIPGGYKPKSGRMSAKENDKQREAYKLDLAKILAGKDKRTSLMIRNIPNKYNQTMLTAELDINHQGLYDYIYLPIDPKNKCNCGYAFINLVHPVIILSLYKEFNGRSWSNFNSEKICELTYGRLQGRDQLLAQLEGSGVMQQSDPGKKPLILDTETPDSELLEKIKQDFIATYGFP